MKKSDIYEIAIKILGLYLVTILLWQLRDILSSISLLIQSRSNPKIFEGFDQTPILLISISSFLVLTIISGLLIFKTKAITKLICKSTDYEDSVSLFAEKTTIYEIALTIVGLLLIVETFPDFAYKLKKHIQFIKSDYPQKEYETMFFMTSLIKILVGLIAIIYSNQLANFFGKKNKSE
ncbi:hypothetical protein [Flavobacterium acetivorans]|uniref:hypothetical protein n=1 Tax=Flavobacterium acetivorans TaxID=2893883 RepID=UPI001E2EEF2C|nr:hypothetical protein [Flavobacterium sp. F-29]UFH36445.1 hypothetical protein LNP19_05230 [Flavobacterium sp. F-29]